jgi:SAM-dependent methyltransferase
LEARLPSYDRYLYTYSGDLEQPAAAAQYVRHKLDQLAFGKTDPRGKTVLDAGSGFGLTLVLYGFLGAAGVFGLEVREKMVRTCEAYAALLPNWLRDRLDVRQGNVAAMPYADSTFDLVLSNEAISHYADVRGFLAETARVLKPGGTLLIADGNNGLNPFVRRRTYEVWKAYERGPAGIDVHGHPIGDEFGPFVDVRRRVIGEAFPGSEEEDQERLALRTAGMTATEVVDAARRYFEVGELPSSVYRQGDLAVDPISTQVMERLFNPFRLGREIASNGFRVKVRGYWGGASGRRGLRVANAMLGALSPLTMMTARAFRIAAYRL